MRARLVGAFDRFCDVGSMGDREVAQLLHDLGVDIAVDLKGHTEGARPGILAYRPAPIQVAYLGYPGPLGLDFIDDVVADRIVLPFDQQRFYRERIVHLPIAIKSMIGHGRLQRARPRVAKWGCLRTPWCSAAHRLRGPFP
jgi:predicted O-linked N-acetylglucosamine transferase (SPINDLY family)